MKTSHTPGPWSAECALSSDLFNIRYVTGLNCEKVCDVNHRVEMPQEVALANAKLIAASPDLLEAARLALQLIKDTWIEEHGNQQVGMAWGALEQAINKATGSKS